MDTRTRWIIGLLLALVIGLAVGLVIVAGDESDDATVTLQPTSETTESETTETETTETTPTNTSGGTPAPSPDDAGGGGSGL
ncbi:MAG: hypothetical protein ACRDK5_06340 [Solirubrobacterales bacterium]